MVTIPSPLFCTSPDPCSCVGGGIEEIYVAFCKEQELTNNVTNSSTKINAQGEYQSLFAFLGKDSATVLVSLGVIILTGLGFWAARMSMSLTSAERRRREVEAQNKQIRKEM